MLKNFIFFLLFLLSQAFYAQRDQFIKWGAGIYYNQNYFGEDQSNTLSPFIYCNVALSENDVYDSSDLYLEPSFEFGLPKHYNDRLDFYTLSAGVSLKKHFSFGNQKRNFFLMLGGKSTMINWNLKYSRNNENLTYRKIKIDYSGTGGFGIVISDHLESVILYQMSFNKAYADQSLANYTKGNIISIGIRYSFIRNWWFSKVVF